MPQEIDWEDFKELLMNLQKACELIHEVAIQFSACADRLQELIDCEDEKK